MIPLIAAWLVLAIIIGFFGRNRRFRFWGYFFASVLLTPIIGLLLLIAAIPVRQHRPVARR
ncbi:MAG: hypothetical protein Q8O42_15705 [Acidobacteriota bacterium]|nr:hypothetical protein [Acidobacteriota bacterium]